MADNTQHDRNASPYTDHCDHPRVAQTRYVNSVGQHHGSSAHKLRPAPDSNTRKPPQTLRDHNLLHASTQLQRA
ncbi:MAG: hypothetical protein SGI99_00665, partial [Pseudomonadota bacterium]|nr:hypothetical protein [Pseudomonadota bacterium]